MAFMTYGSSAGGNSGGGGEAMGTLAAHLRTSGAGGGGFNLVRQSGPELVPALCSYNLANRPWREARLRFAQAQCSSLLPDRVAYERCTFPLIYEVPAAECPIEARICPEGFEQHLVEIWGRMLWDASRPDACSRGSSGGSPLPDCRPTEIRLPDNRCGCPAGHRRPTLQEQTTIGVVGGVPACIAEQAPASTGPCPQGTMARPSDGRCLPVPASCPPGQVFDQGVWYCVSVPAPPCPSGQSRNAAGSCTPATPPPSERSRTTWIVAGIGAVGLISAALILRR